MASNPLTRRPALAHWLVVILLSLLGTTLLVAPVLAAPITFVRPVDGPLITEIQPPAQPWFPGHRGVDLAAQPGEPIRASRDGRITFAGQVAGTGWLTIDHGGGLETTYGPIALPPMVSAGTRVQAGHVIATLAPGQDHLDLGARTPHPHWPGHYRYLNPLELDHVWTIRIRAHGNSPGRGP